MTARNRAYERYSALVGGLGEQDPGDPGRVRGAEVAGTGDRPGSKGIGRSPRDVGAFVLYRRDRCAPCIRGRGRGAGRASTPAGRCCRVRCSAQRDGIAQATGVPAEELPFAAELIDVDPDEKDRWAGAAERVLRGLGMTMLVPETHRRTIGDFVNRTNLGGVLEYRVYQENASAPSTPVPGSLAEKLLVDRRHPAGAWLANVVAHSAEHICVELPAQLENHLLAVTPQGLVKSGRDRFRKDDRRSRVGPYPVDPRVEHRRQASRARGVPGSSRSGVPGGPAGRAGQAGPVGAEPGTREERRRAGGVRVVGRAQLVVVAPRCRRVERPDRSGSGEPGRPRRTRRAGRDRPRRLA